MTMRMTMTEGLGLIAAAILGASLTLPTHAGPPRAAPDETRRALQRLAEDVAGLADGGEQDSKGEALFSVARAQQKLGDRAAALATLRRLDELAEPAPSKSQAGFDLRRWGRFEVLIQSAEIRRDCGDPDGARAVLERASQFLERHHDAVAAAYGRITKDVDRALVDQPEGLRRLSDEEAAFLCEASIALIDQYVALGHFDRARALIRRAIESVGPVRSPMNTVMIATLGGYLIKAGDPEGRALIAQAKQAALALPKAEARAFALEPLACTLAEAGDLDGALALVPEMEPRTRQAALTRILEGMSVDDHRVAWLDFGGMNIKIGDPSLTPKDPAAARAALPRIAAAARAAGDARIEARTLATVALLQARAGDFAGALATARSIPALCWSDFPGARDGYYEAVKPAALALVAGVQAAAGDRAAATAVLGEAGTLARAIGAADQRLIAQVVVAQQQAAGGQLADALATVTEAVPLALAQSEPRRSRVLTMLADVQVLAGDLDGALRTIDAIRDYPGLEKARALSALARRRRETGETAASNALWRRAAASLESKAPAAVAAARAPVLNVRAFARDTFVDFDLELDENVLRRERESWLRDIRAELGDIEAVVREARHLPPAHRNAVVAQAVGNLARRGDVAAARDLAVSIDSPEGRLGAFAALAAAIP